MNVVVDGTALFAPHTTRIQTNRRWTFRKHEQIETPNVPFNCCCFVCAEMRDASSLVSGWVDKSNLGTDTEYMNRCVRRGNCENIYILTERF